MLTRCQCRLRSRKCPKVERLVLVTHRRFPPPWSVQGDRFVFQGVRDMDEYDLARRMGGGVRANLLRVLPARSPVLPSGLSAPGEAPDGPSNAVIM
jgi:hypothetical protein